MIKKPCRANPNGNRCTTTGLSGDVICRNCGMTDYTRLQWGAFSDKQKLVEILLCEYRLRHYEECVKSVRRVTDEL